MIGATDIQNLWVEKVLGVKFSSMPPRSGPRPAMNIWLSAKDEIDQRLTALAGALHDYDDPDLDRIADYGLFGIGRGESVALTAALLEADKVGAPPASRNRLAKAIAAYRSMLSSRLVQYVDNNPVGVPVGMAARLGAALAEIEQTTA